MKKTLLFIMALLIGSLSAHADFVTKEEAEAKAQNFISQHIMSSGSGSLANSKAVAEKKQLVCVSNFSKEEKPAYYIFNYADSTGFVIVSAESNTLEILAYSDQDYFHEEDIDKGAEVFLAQYERDATIARTNALTAKQKEYVRNTTKASSEVLLETACLNQTDGYWNDKYTPLADAPAGCTATAAAIIMHYHQWPAQGKGSNSYISDTHGLSLSRDFSQDTYNWACIPKTPYYEGGWSEEAKNEVPKILLACGIACNMDYDYGGSGASTYHMLKSMVEKFSYGIEYKSFQFYGNPDADMTEAWQAARNSIDNNMPVFVAATGSRGGHAFVLDGYNSQYYHYNMGWGGSNNGWWSNGSISYDNYSLYEFYTDISPQSGKIIKQGTSPEGITYKLDDCGVLRISGNGEITESFDKYIQDCYNATECIIEEGVTAIKTNYLINLSFCKLTLPASVKEIYALPSYYLREIIIAEDNPVFSSPGNCSIYNKDTKTLQIYSRYEKEIHFPEGVEILGDYLFDSNYEIEEVDVPEGVTSIGSSAFMSTEKLKKVTLPSTLKDMGDYCFSHSGVKTVVCKAMYPPSPAYSIFYDCDMANSGTLYVPYNAVDKYANNYGWGMSNDIKPIPGSENWENPYKVQVSVTTAGTLEASIGKDPADIKELTVTGPINGTDLKYIRSLCKLEDSNCVLTVLDLSKARIVAGGDVFYTTSYGSFSITEDDVIPSRAFNSCNLDILKIPETTKKICSFVLPQYLKNIDLPEGLKRIERDAFWNSMSLESLHIPASVEYIGESMSAASWNLTEMDVAKDNKYYKSEGNIIYTIDGKTVVAAAIINDEVLNIPEGVENIYSYTFYGNNFKKLCLPSTLKNISYDAFSYTRNLIEVTCLATVPPQAQDAFDENIINSCTLYVPSASVNSYSSATMWSSFYQIKDLTTSAIDETIQSPLTSKQAIFDLSGRRISNTSSLRPGIYIINGKKVRK